MNKTILMLLLTLLLSASPALAVFENFLFFRSGGQLNGQTIDADHTMIVVDPGEAISGTIYLQAQTNRASGHVIPVAGSKTWGSRSGSVWGIHHDIRPGTTDLSTSINTVAPDQPGLYHFIFAFEGEYTYAEVMSATSRHSPGIWNDGNDLGWDWAEAQFDSARNNGWVMNQKFRPGRGWSDSRFGANVIDVQVGQIIPEPATMLAGIVGLAATGRYLRRRQNHGTGTKE
jgi:hypothetical protein